MSNFIRDCVRQLSLNRNGLVFSKEAKWIKSRSKRYNVNFPAQSKPYFLNTPIRLLETWLDNSYKNIHRIKARFYFIPPLS